MFNRLEKFISDNCENMFNFKTFEIWRPSESDDESLGSFYLGYSNTGRSITGNLKMAGAEFSMMVDGAFGKTYILKTDDVYSDIQEGDRLKIGEEYYEVQGFTRNVDTPSRKMSITLIKVISA
jgi:hypothetical protein